MDWKTELRDAKSLLDEGIYTQKEFDAEKKRILASRFQHQDNNPQKEHIESLDTIKNANQESSSTNNEKNLFVKNTTWFSEKLRHFFAMTVQDNPRLLWCSLLLLVPILWFNLSWYHTIVEEVDHCNIAQCDFVRHYLPQAEKMLSNRPKIVKGWFYPPLLAFLLVPFTWISDATTGWLIINLCALIGMCWCCVRFTKTSWLISFLICCQSLPILHNLKWGQISLIISTLIIWALFHKSTRIRMSVFALCSVLKVYPVLLLVPSILKKRWKETLEFGIACLILFLIPTLWMGWDFSITMWENVIEAAQKVRQFASKGGGQSLNSVLNRLFHDSTHVHLGKRNGGLIMTLPNMWVQIFYGIAMCVILFRSVKSYVFFSGRIEKTLLFWVVIHLFLSPGWHHYMSFLPFILLWCYHKEEGFSFSGLGLICICVPTLLIGHTSKVYAIYSAFGGTFWALFLCWFSLCKIAKGYSHVKESASNIESQVNISTTIPQ